MWQVLIAAYMTKNVVRNARAECEFKLDWEDVQLCEQAEEGGGRGASIQYQASKNNKEQRDRVKPLWCRTACTGEVHRMADGKLSVDHVCPVHLMMHAKQLQAERVGVPIEALKGPVSRR
jgi:hypothetical protein